MTEEMTQNQPRNVVFLIKDPYNPNMDTVKMDFSLEKTSTVADLKKRIELDYPTNPEPSKQRLIYFGKMLLDDKLIMTDILARADLEEPQHLHLLIPVTSSPPLQPSQATSPPPIPALGSPVSTSQTPQEHREEVSANDDQNVEHHLEREDNHSHSSDDSLSQEDFERDQHPNETPPSFYQQNSVYAQYQYPSSNLQAYGYPFSVYQQQIYLQQQMYYQQQIRIATLAGMTGATAALRGGSEILSPSDRLQVPVHEQGGDGLHQRRERPQPERNANAGTRNAQSMEFDPHSLGGHSAALALLRQVDAAQEDGDMIEEASFSSRSEDLRGFTQSSPITVSPEPEKSMASEAFFSEDLNELPEPTSYEECVEHLKVHYDKLLQAIETSKRIQDLNSNLLAQQFSPFSYQPFNNQYNGVPWQQMSEMMPSGAWQNEANDRDGMTAQQQQQQQQGQGVGDGVENPVGGAAAPGGVRQAVPRVIIINVRLIIKLALFVYVMNNDTTSTRFYVFVAIAIFAYFYETGYLEPIIGSREYQHQLLQRLRIVELGHIGTEAQVPHGLLADTYYFFKSFLLSLIPAWRVAARSDPSPMPTTGQLNAPPEQQAPPQRVEG